VVDLARLDRRIPLASQDYQALSTSVQLSGPSNYYDRELVSERS
jgi:hypothetical protein